MTDLTADLLQRLFYAKNLARYDIIAPNIYLDWMGCEMDLLALRKSGYVDEIEIKISAADFRADFRKTVRMLGDPQPDHLYSRPGHPYQPIIDMPKHEALQAGKTHANRFYFLIPEEIADKCEPPDYAGLLVCRPGRNGRGYITERQPARLLHKRKLDPHLRYQIGRKMAFRFWREFRQVNTTQTENRDVV